MCTVFPTNLNSSYGIKMFWMPGNGSDYGIYIIFGKGFTERPKYFSSFMDM